MFLNLSLNSDHFNDCLLPLHIFRNTTILLNQSIFVQKLIKYVPISLHQSLDPQSNVLNCQIFRIFHTTINRENIASQSLFQENHFFISYFGNRVRNLCIHESIFVLWQTFENFLFYNAFTSEKLFSYT